MIVNNIAARRLRHVVYSSHQTRCFSQSVFSRQQQVDIEKVKRDQFANLNVNKQKTKEDKSQHKTEKKSAFKSLLIGITAGTAFVGLGYFLLNASLIETQERIVGDLSEIEQVKTKRQLEAEWQQKLEEQHQQLLDRRQKARGLPESPHEQEILARIELESKRKWNAMFQRIAAAFDETEVERQKREYDQIKSRVLQEVQQTEGLAPETVQIKEIIRD